MKSLLFLVLVSVSLFEFSSYGKIIGEDTLKVVNAEGTNVPFKYKAALEAFGIMSMGCTATHIGNGLVISAGHCFSAGKLKFKTNCDGIQVFWGVREGKNASSVSNCKQLLVLEDTNYRDYALFRVDNFPRVGLPLKWDQPVAVSTRITIFSHPFNQGLTWSGVCAVTKSFVPDPDQGNISTHSMQYRCDTNPGSSGATILDAETLQIVGIHSGGWSQGQSGSSYGTYINLTYIPTVLTRLGRIQVRR